MSYITLSGPVMFKTGPEGYLALMRVDANPRLVCTLKKNNVSSSAPNEMFLHQVDAVSVEDMQAILNFTVAVVKHGEFIKLVNNDALSLAILLQVSMKSTNPKLQESLAKLKIVMVAEAPTSTGVNNVSFDKGMIKTFQPVTLANATSITLTLAEL